MRGFQDTMRQNPSAGELAVRCRLESMGIHLQYDRVILFFADEYKVFPKDIVTNAMLKQAEGFTLPDAWSPDKKIPIYLDGPVHEKRGRRNKDDGIDAKLKNRGIAALRFPFKPSGRRGIAEWRLAEICGEIREAVTK